jgi:flavin-dependent dehydrogenase
MTGASTPCICVLGAGPAGCVTAYRLATLGHKVVLLARPRPQRHPMGESAPISIMQLLGGVGLDDIASMATYRVATQALTLWGAEEPIAHPSPALLLRRDLFDALLRMAAQRVDVRVLEGGPGSSPRRRPDGGWKVPFVTASREACVDATVLVDARGRRGGGRRMGAATVALAACWRDAAPLPATTCLEATTDAWAWGGVAPGGRQSAVCFVDPHRVAGLDASGRMALYTELLARMRLLRPLLTGRISNPPVVVDATARLGARIAEPDLIAVGDTAVATEPLSSQGVQSAIVSALQGAAVVHTVLTRPEDVALALEFHRASRRAAARGGARQTATFHAAVLARFDTSFWRRRAVAGAEARQPVPPEAVTTDLPIFLSPWARLQDAPVLDGALIRRRRVLDHPGLDGPFAYLGAVELAPLLEATTFPTTATELLRAWSKQIGPRSAHAVLVSLRKIGVLVTA